MTSPSHIHTAQELTKIQEAIASNDLVPDGASLNIVTLPLREELQTAALEVVGTQRSFYDLIDRLRSLPKNHPVRPMAVDSFYVAIAPEAGTIDTKYLYGGRYWALVTNPIMASNSLPLLQL